MFQSQCGKRKEGFLTEAYTTPEVRLLGTVSELTESFDKIGSTADIYTPAIPLLDGDIEVDP